MPKQLCLYLIIPLALLWPAVASAEPADYTDIAGLRLSMALSSWHVRTGDTVTLYLRAQPYDEDNDIYFVVDFLDFVPTGYQVAPGRLRCIEHAGIVCFAEDIAGPEYIEITGTITGPADERNRFFWITAGSINSRGQYALRLTWQQTLFFPQVTNGQADHRD